MEKKSLISNRLSKNATVSKPVASKITATKLAKPAATASVTRMANPKTAVQVTHMTKPMTSVAPASRLRF